MNRIQLVTIIILLGTLLAIGLSCDDESEESPVATTTPTPIVSPTATPTDTPTLIPTPPTPTPTPSPTPTPTSTVTSVPIQTPTPIPTTTVTPTETPLPTRDTGSCIPDRDEIQAALDAYHTEKGEWPTIDGYPGDIEWAKLIPDILDGVPNTDSSCEWQVDDNPEGAICLLTPC